MLKPPEQPSLLPYDREARNQKTQAARAIAAIAAATGVILFFLHHTIVHVQLGSVHVPTLSRTEYNCLWLFASLFITYQVVSDIRSGVTDITGLRDRLYTRSSDPVGYWILIALHGALAAGFFIVMLGNVLGLWNVNG